MAEFSDVTRLIERFGRTIHGKGASKGELLQIERHWGPLPSDYRAFLANFGWLAFGSTQISGVGSGVPAHLELMAQAYDMWNSGVPKELLPIYSAASDWLYCLKAIGDRTVVVVYSLEDECEDPEEQYDTWSDWFIQMFGIKES